MKLEQICSEIAKNCLPKGTKMTCNGVVIEIVEWVFKNGTWLLNMKSKDSSYPDYTWRSHTHWRKLE